MPRPHNLVRPQIIDSIDLIARDARGNPLEVSLTRNLGHVNLMCTVTHAFGDAAAAPGGGVGCGGRGIVVTGRTVCWMVFEHCDLGTVAVGAGWECGLSPFKSQAKTNTIS